MAYKRDPVAPMKIAVQAKLYTKTVSPTYVRDLYGTMQHEGATLGIMITTSGYGPGSVEFANGKPLHLIDGTGLIVDLPGTWHPRPHPRPRQAQAQAVSSRGTSATATAWSRCLDERLSLSSLQPQSTTTRIKTL